MQRQEKKQSFLEAHAMHISAKFQLDPHIASEEKNIFSEIYLLVAMTINQIERFGQKVYV